MKLKILLIVINYLVVLFTNVINCQMSWVQLFDTLSYKQNIKPTPRRDSTIAYDRERNRVILFGGCQTQYVDDLNPVIFDDTWEFNLNTLTWKELTISPMKPHARYGMTYGHNKYGLYISGGRSYLNHVFSDVWVFDFSSDLWRRMEETGYILPRARYSGAGGVYPSYEVTDSRTSSFYMAFGQSYNFLFGNVFRYGFTDARSGNGIWYESFKDYVGPFGADYAHARYGHSATMIAPDVLLVFGGCLSGKLSGGPCPSSDSWIYNAMNNRWKRVSSSCISPRLYSSMSSLVTDGYRYSAVLFSGLETDTTVYKTVEEQENEVTVYDSLYHTWVKKLVQGFYFPEKRNGHVMCTGKFNNEYGVFMFGGYGHFSESNIADLWFLKANATTAFNSVTINKCSRTFTTIHLHAILMFVGWFIFLNIGVFVARYGRESCSKWVKIHAALQIIGLVIITAGMVFGFWSTRGIPHLAHLIIGLSAYLLAFSQPITAYMRLRAQKTDYYIDEGEKLKAIQMRKKIKNNLWLLFHRHVGVVGLLFAIINTSLGVFYAVLEWFWFTAWFIFLFLNIALYVGIEIRLRFYNRSEQHQQQTNMNDRNLNETYDETLSKADSMLHLRSNQTLVEDLNITPRFNPEQFKMELLNNNNNKVNTQRYVQINKNLPIKNTPPPPYNRNFTINNNATQSKPNNYVKSTSPKLSTPKPSQLLAFSEAKTHNNYLQAKNFSQSYSRQLLVESQNDDSESELYTQRRSRTNQFNNTRSQFDYDRKY